MSDKDGSGQTETDELWKLASWIVEYEFQNPEARWKTRGELIEKYASMIAGYSHHQTKGMLNELNKELFYETTEPKGQFVKDTIIAKLETINAELWPRLKEQSLPTNKDKETL